MLKSQLLLSPNWLLEQRQFNVLSSQRTKRRRKTANPGDAQPAQGDSLRITENMLRVVTERFDKVKENENKCPQTVQLADPCATVGQLHPTQAVSGFLSDVDPFSRRCLLAEHFAFCLAMKDAEQCQDYLNEERAQQIDASTITTTTAPHGCNGTAQGNLNVSSFVPQVLLQEPRILRTTIYEKFVTHFQQFHNEQDALGLVSLVLYPCFAPDIVRETNFWMRSSLSLKMAIAGSRSSVGTEGVYEHYSQFFETFSDALLIYEKTTIKQVMVPNGDHKSFSSEKAMMMVVTPFTYFLTLILPTDETGKLLLCIEASEPNLQEPSKVASNTEVSSNMSVSSQTTNEASSADSLMDFVELSHSVVSKPVAGKVSDSHRTASPYPRTIPSPFHGSPLPGELAMKAFGRCDVRLEFSGYNILYFDHTDSGQIVKGIDHVHLTNCSHSSLNLKDLLTFVGFEVITGI
jgi:hypothetical protein